MKLLKIPKKYYDDIMDNLSHFMESDHKVCVNKENSDIIKKYQPYLKVKKTNEWVDRPYDISLIKKIPLEHEVLYWEQKYEWANKEENRLYFLAKEMING